MKTRRGLRLLGHPVHPMLAHFPMALLALVFPLESAGRMGWGMGPILGYWAGAGGLLFALPAALAGLFDLVAVAGRPRLSALANRHMGVMLGSVGLFGLDLFYRGAPVSQASIVNLALSGSGLALLLWGGRLGGEMVYRHGAAQDPTG